MGCDNGCKINLPQTMSIGIRNTVKNRSITLFVIIITLIEVPNLYS